MKEKILCAAIWYKELETPKFLPYNVDKGAVFCGHRHAHCIHLMIAMTGKRSVTPECGEYIQGFLTNLNRFVDREEAMRIATEAGQIIRLERVGKEDLFSEDLY